MSRTTTGPRYALVIRSLAAGGAERQLVILACAMVKAGRSVVVVTFYDGGEFARSLAACGVSVISLGKSGRWDTLGFALRLVKTIRKLNVDVVVGFLEGANVMLVALRRWLPGKRIVNRLAASYMDLSRYDWLSALSFKAELWFAARADLVIVNSRAGAARAERAGVDPGRIALVRNAVDTGYFKADPEGGRSLREKLGVPDDHALVGLVGRLDPMKDHPVFVRAAAEIQRQRDDLMFVCAGGGTDPAYELLIDQEVQRLPDPERFRMLGHRSDLPAVYSALDVTVLSSYGEGSPNAVAESMACGTPCVVTDVGDARSLVGDTGEVVPVKDPRQLAAGIIRLLERLKRQADLGFLCRRRIVEEFSSERVLEAFESALSGPVGGVVPRG